MAREVEALTAIDRCAHGGSAKGAGPPAGGAASSLRLSLSNRTALEMPIGEIIGDFLVSVLGLSHGLRTDVASAVHEAVLNAVLHGNLAMASEGRGHSAGIEDFRRQIEARLADPVLYARRCDIRVRWKDAAILVRISDQGGGFVPDAVSGGGPHPFGRGIRVIRALATRCRWARGGRSVMLRFAR